MIERPRPGCVEVYFIDRDGVRWKLYQWGVVAGRRIKYAIGSTQGDYRGFVRVDDPTVTRVHMMFLESPVERALQAHQLQRQLEASKRVTPRPRSSTAREGA